MLGGRGRFGPAPGPVAAALPGVTLPGLTLPGLTLPGLARGSGDLVSLTQAILTDLVGRDVDVVAAHPVAGGPDEGPAIPDVEDPRHRDQRVVSGFPLGGVSCLQRRAVSCLLRGVVFCLLHRDVFGLPRRGVTGFLRRRCRRSLLGNGGHNLFLSMKITARIWARRNELVAVR